MDTNGIKVEWADEGEKEREKTVSEFQNRQYETVRENGRTYLARMREAAYEDEECILAEGWTKGLLKASARSRNGEECCFYDITGKQSLIYECEKSGLDFGKLCMLLVNAGSCLEKMAEYLLREDGVVLDPAYIFAGIDGEEWLFLYDPAQKGTFAGHIREFAGFLAQKIDYRDEKAVELAGCFCRYADGENFSMNVFLEENRQYFEMEENSGTCQPETEDDADLQEAVSEWKREECGGSYDAGMRADEHGGRLRIILAIASAALMVCAAWRLSASDAAAILFAGVGAGIAAVFLYAYIGYAKKLLLKKETEVYQLTPPEEDLSKSGNHPALQKEK